MRQQCARQKNAKGTCKHPHIFGLLSPALSPRAKALVGGPRSSQCSAKMAPPPKKQEKPRPVIRLLMIGDSGAGKTSLVVRYDEDSFSAPPASEPAIDATLRRRSPAQVPCS